MTWEQLKAIPKIDLHCHLDGSLSRACVQKLAGRAVLAEELQVSDDCEDLKTYLEKFELPVSLLQTEASLKKAVYDVIQNAAAEQVCYMEIRFAPMLSVQNGLSCEQVIAAALAGLEEAQKVYPVKAQMIACAMRHHTLEQNQKLLDAAALFLGKGLCAVDLAGNEAAFPMKNFRELFQQAHHRGIPFTIHAGECGSVENVIEAVQCGAQRIGHGIALSGQEEAIRFCREKTIGLELCPISNLQTKSVQKKEDYPLREFLDAGLLVTINTDNRTVSNTTLTRELNWIQTQYRITDAEIWQLQKNALEVSFAPEEWKAQLQTIIKL